MRSSSLAQNIDKVYPLSPKLKRAFTQIPREVFVPKGMKHLAHKLDALPIIEEQWISSPVSVAKMTQSLKLEDVDSVLEIGCGSGYQAAILSKLVRRVFTIERIERLYLEAKHRFHELHLSNINLRYADGLNGWSQFAPYDRVLFSASIESVPQKVVHNLKEGGYLVAPMQKEGKQRIVRFLKRGDRLVVDAELEECCFICVKRAIQ